MIAHYLNTLYDVFVTSSLPLYHSFFPCAILVPHLLSLCHTSLESRHLGLLLT